MQAIPARSLLYFLSREQRAEGRGRGHLAGAGEMYIVPTSRGTGTESWEVHTFRLFLSALFKTFSNTFYRTCHTTTSSCDIVVVGQHWWFRSGVALGKPKEIDKHILTSNITKKNEGNK